MQIWLCFREWLFCQLLSLVLQAFMEPLSFILKSDTIVPRKQNCDSTCAWELLLESPINLP